MFSWITGPRLANAIEDLQPESNYESTIIDAPETPAPQFAVNAFKHALFGTPAPDDAKKAPAKLDRKAKLDAANIKPIELSAPAEEGPLLSPSKQPGGILMTPGTASKGRKTVSFGSQVVDNEGKRGNIGKSGIPNNCPGKFPSPWTPGTELRVDVASDKRPRTKLTEALLDARTTVQPKSGQKPKARDDSDITIDLGAPRSESGKYWKEQYESYAERSEKEMKKVIAKQQLAKKFAMKKDGEVTELATKIELERKKFKQRERELEQQNKDIEEKLRLAITDNTAASIEIAALKKRIAILEHSTPITSSDMIQSKPSFEIYEDASKEAINVSSEDEKNAGLSFAPSLSMASSGKENNSPRAQRQHRRRAVPETSTRTGTSSRFGTGEGEVSIILGRSPRVSTQPIETLSDAVPAPVLTERLSRSPVRTRRAEATRDNSTTQPPDALPPSSPLPMPSPGMNVADPWMDFNLNNQSSIQQIDKLAMPNYGGEPFSRPEWNPPPRQHRTSKSVSNAKITMPSKPLGGDSGKEKAPAVRPQLTERTAHDAKAHTNIASNSEGQQNHKASFAKSEVSRKAGVVSEALATDLKSGLSKVTHHPQSSSETSKEQAEISPEERKANAKKRLEERRRLRQLSQK